MAAVPELGEPGSFWQGADGNVWVAGKDGTNSAGAYGPGTFNYWNSRRYKLINDPTGQFNPLSGGDASTPPAGGDGGGSGTQFKDTSALRAAAQASLESLGSVKNSRFAEEDAAYKTLESKYNAERAKEQARFGKQTTDNEVKLASDQQAGMLAAAQGGRGLRATLAAMGALGGTGAVLADRAIMDSANKDLGGAQDNFKTNAETLQTAWGDFEDQDEARRQEAQALREQNKRAVEAEIMATRQKLLQDMAGYWEAAGNTGEYNRIMGEATALTPQIARMPQGASRYTAKAASFDPAELQTYLAGNRDMTVGRKPGAAGTALNNPLYALSGKKEEEIV